MKVDSVTIVNGQYTEMVKVGQDNICKIIDKSIEFDNSYVSLYFCLDKEGNIIRSIENCSVDVKYVKE